jgi:hypothetical protein
MPLAYTDAAMLSAVFVRSCPANGYIVLSAASFFGRGTICGRLEFDGFHPEPGGPRHDEQKYSWLAFGQNYDPAIPNPTTGRPGPMRRG